MNVTKTGRGLSGVDFGLIILFLLGLYTHYTIQITATVPFPAAPSGIAGMALLWRRRNDITAGAFTGFMVVVLFYVMSILCATDYSFLGRRFNGLIQITYSLVIGFTFFLTLTMGTRDQIARLFLTSALIILVGCLLEQYGGLRPISDAVRNKIYSSGVYEADTRDMLIYGHVRPKFFASEPSAVSLSYVIFVFAWLVTSTWRWKLPAYVGLVGAGYVAVTGPTLLLMFVMLVPYELFIVGDRGKGGLGSIKLFRYARVAVVGLLLCVVAYFAAEMLFAKRLHEITSGTDPSFFYRVEGPAIAAQQVIAHYPIAGAGLTGEPFIEDVVVNAYIGSPNFSRDWTIASASSELLINYFWLHWIYLGLFWGVLMVIVISLWLRAAGVRQVAFCWFVWAILGQSSGAYVGPMTWAIFFLCAAVAKLAAEQPVVAARPVAPATFVARMPIVRWRGPSPRLIR
ncbi:MAG TPA: hypothetical protein VGG27_14300 [Magnetospirillaceae bacterium]|jgi:hypothetical protein